MEIDINIFFNNQIEIGDRIKNRITGFLGKEDLDKLSNIYREWDKDNITYLNVTIGKKNYLDIYDFKYFRSKNLDYDSYEGRLHEIQTCLDKKLNIIKSINQEIVNKTPININSMYYKTRMKKIFISHSSIDKKIIDPFIDLLEIIGMKHHEIFYSSHPSTGVGLGENILERIKTELSNDVLVLFVISENFYKSPVCLCEMGATWIKTNKHIPILIPPFAFNQVKGVFVNSLGFYVNDKEQLNELKLKLEQEFNLIPINLTRWEDKRNKFVENVNLIIGSV